jgi:hypothetical protein
VFPPSSTSQDGHGVPRQLNDGHFNSTPILIWTGLKSFFHSILVKTTLAETGRNEWNFFTLNLTIVTSFEAVTKDCATYWGSQIRGQVFAVSSWFTRHELSKDNESVWVLDCWSTFNASWKKLRNLKSIIYCCSPSSSSTLKTIMNRQFAELPFTKLPFFSPFHWGIRKGENHRKLASIPLVNHVSSWHW